MDGGANPTHDEDDARDGRLMAEERFDELVARYLNIIRRRCALRVRGAGDADDVAQDVVVRLLRQLQRGTGFSVPFRVVVHKRIDWEIKDFQKRWQREQQRRAPLEEADERWRGEDSLLAILDRDEVERLLHRIPDRDREILELVYLEGQSIAQCAERLGITRNAADQRLHRARRKVRHLVDG